VSRPFVTVGASVRSERSCCSFSGAPLVGAAAGALDKRTVNLYWPGPGRWGNGGPGFHVAVRPQDAPYGSERSTGTPPTREAPEALQDPLQDSHGPVQGPGLVRVAAWTQTTNSTRAATSPL
jgi:hypothetical protein